MITSKQGLQDEEIIEERLREHNEEMTDTLENTPPEKVELEAKTLRDLLFRLESLEKERDGTQKNAGLFKEGKWVDEPKEERLHTATLRKFRFDTDSDYMYVTDFKFLMWSFNEGTKEREQIYKISFYDPKNKDTLLNPLVKTYPLKYYAENFERETVQILEWKKTPKIMLTGKTMKREHNFAKFKSTELGVVPTYERKDDIECMIQLKEGTKFWINADRLNA